MGRKKRRESRSPVPSLVKTSQMFCVGRNLRPQRSFETNDGTLRTREDGRGRENKARDRGEDR
jgi:hypothetical protein